MLTYFKRHQTLKLPPGQVSWELSYGDLPHRVVKGRFQDLKYLLAHFLLLGKRGLKRLVFQEFGIVGERIQSKKRFRLSDVVTGHVVLCAERLHCGYDFLIGSG